jgi:hypothetical protein
MTVNYTTLLGLAKPVSGTESGTWGDTVNTNLTDYLDSAVAGTQIISGSLTAVTLSKTTGSSLSQAGTGSTGSSQYQIIRCTGNPASLLTITAPAADKTYIVINATSTSQSVKIVGAGPTTGVTILSGKTSLVAWNGSDFVEVSPNTISGVLPVANGGTGATTLTGVLKGNGTSAFTAASSGTDYSAGTSALATGILKSTTTTGALTIAVAGDFPTLNQSTTGTAATATNLASGSAGTIPYQSASGTTAMLAAGTSGQVLTSNGAAAPTWATASGGGTKTISNKTAAYTVVAGDLGKIINCTSGTFTVSLTAAATLGSGFTCTIWNTSNTIGYVITIDPSGTETIDGVASLQLRRGEGLAIVCNGTNWETDDKKPMRGYAENLLNSGDRPVASGDSSIALGRTSTASGAFSLSLGVYGTTAGADYSTALGLNSSLAGSVTATGAGAMALGGSYASGTDSFAAAIANNTSSYGATGANSVAIGYRNKASGANSAAVGGGNSIASGVYSVVIGDSCQATEANSIAIGDSAISSVVGRLSFSSSPFAVAGDCQTDVYTLQASTTDATLTYFSTDGSGNSGTTTVVFNTNSVAAYSGLITARQKTSNGSIVAAWRIEGLFHRDGTNVALDVNTTTTIQNSSGLSITVAANSSGGISIRATGLAATNIRWAARVETIQLQYA